MTRALMRTSFHSAELIRVLAGLSLLDVVQPSEEFAEKLGTWVSFTDAITLSAMHSANAATPAETSVGVTTVEGTDLGRVLARVQAGLVSSIGRLPSELATPEPDALADPLFAFEPYRRYYQTQQREVDVKLSTLRVHVREVLGKSGPRLRRLAALDLALDGILCEREEKLLLKLPSLLEKRFKQLCKAQPNATGWLTDFGKEMQTVLLAELDLRMQPVLGLIEAYQLDSTTGQHKINE